MENVKNKNIHSHGTLASYTAGFVLSLILTLGAYLAVQKNTAHPFISNSALLATIIVLAMVQLIIQLIFFLHLHIESGPRWNLAIFLSTISIIVIIVIGSLWIMNHLNYNMTPEQINNYLIDQSG